MKKTLKNLKKVYKYGREFRGALILEAIGSIIGIIVEVVLPIISAQQLVLLTDNLWIQLIGMSAIVLALSIVVSLKTVLIRKNTQKFTVGITEKMQKQLGKEILKITQTELDSKSTGVFVQRMTSDTDELSNIFTTGFGRCVGVLSAVGVFVSVFIINKVVFAFYVFASVVLTTYHIIKSKKVNAKDKEKRKAQERVVGLTSELIRGTRDVKMLNAKQSFIKVLNENIKNKNKKYIEMRNIDIEYNLVIDTIMDIFEFQLILLFIFLIMENKLAVPMAIALYTYRYRLLGNLMYNISLLLEECNRFNLSADRVFSILDNKEFKKEEFGKEHIDSVKGNFEFKDVEFAYEDGLKVLDKISFKVKSNTTVGFVGKSGSGKTTIFSLLCKMYNIENGTIKIDGHDIKELDEESIRGNITIIGQSPYIFNMSIIDNMKLVKENITLEEIQDACKLACLDEFIEALPDKYNTIIGEGGVNLSGGQKQRLAIARALIQKTKIILFDEATSALDNFTQGRIQEAINNLKENYTIMIIAHRFSTILNCDEIFFIDKGKIIASGTHEQLLKKCKEYKKLYEAEIKDN